MALCAVSPAADAQFKELGPPPLTPQAARQKFKTLLETVDAGNRRQAVATISGLLPWTELKSNPPILARERNGPANGQSSPVNNGRRRGVSPGGSPLPTVLDHPPAANLPISVTPPPVLTRAPAAPPAPMAPPLYAGAQSGTLTCSGDPVPQNAEYVFRDLPLAKMRLDYDTKTWDAHLSPALGQTQKLILRNKSSNPQKRCEVRWSVIP